MPQLQQCPCGSGEFPDAQHDGYGIFMCYTCCKCEKEKLKRFRSDIFQRYDPYDEQIEDDY